MIKYADLTKKAVYREHAMLLTDCANKILKVQGRPFVIDENNKKVLQFLLYYFNGCDLCEKVFPEKNYTLGKQILLYGEAGVGKTLIMEAFSRYLRETNNPNQFANVSLTQMMNDFSVNENIDKYTFNMNAGGTFEGSPMNICLNDIGVQTHRHYGTDPNIIVEEFLYSRNDIFVSTGKQAHLTTNLDKDDMRQMFGDEYNRLTDRLFNTYNFIPLRGGSRR